MPQTRARSLREIAARAGRIQFFDSRGLDEATCNSLTMVIYAVIFGQVCALITTGAAWTGFLREVLRADDFMLGLIAAVPVAANTVQILIAHWMQRYQKRRFFMLFFGILARFFWIPIALVPYLVPSHSTQMMLVSVFVVAVAVGNSFVNLGYASLMADIVPMRIRGSYFASRLAVSMVTGLLGALLASYLVDKLGMAGYSIALILAGATGMIDITFFFRVDFPPMEAPGEGERPGLFSSLRAVLGDGNFMRVVLCFTCWTFGVNIAQPFFNVHMLENLRMSYTGITLTNQIASNVMTLLLLSKWGKPLDRFGNKSILRICALVCMTTPLMWLFATPQTVWLIPFFNMISGIFFPPIDIAQQNFYLGASSSRNRAMYVAVFFAVFNLFGVAFSNVLGGYLLKTAFTSIEAHVPLMHRIGWTKYHLIFLLSGILRIAVVLGLFPSLKEEGGTPPGETARTIGREWYVARVHWWIALRATVLRKRYRKRNPEEAPAATADAARDTQKKRPKQ